MMKKKTVANQKETAELHNRLLRLQADFDNFRKRTENSRFELLRFANQELIAQILPVLDNFKRAISHAPKFNNEPEGNWMTGILAIERQLEDILAQNGLRKIEVKKGQLFDHTLHEAISHEQSGLPFDAIIDVAQQGYIFNDKVIRPAKVRVSAGAGEGLDNSKNVK